MKTHASNCEPDDGRVQSKHHIRTVNCRSDDSSAILCKSDTGCTKARPMVAHSSPAECRELLMDGENLCRRLLLSSAASTAAPSPSHRGEPHRRSHHGEPRHCRPLTESRAVAVSSLRFEPHRRRSHAEKHAFAVPG
jgi:hypothetical protein